MVDVQEEGYPGIVAHGPLLATLMLNVLETHHTTTPTSISYRAVAPVFAPCCITVRGCREGENGFRVWVEREDGVIAMQGVVNG